MVTSVQTSVGDLLFGQTRQALLRLLFTHPDEDFHLRHIVRVTGAGLGPVQREIMKLTNAGLVLRQQRGRQVFYRVNRQSSVHQELMALVIKTSGVAELLAKSLAPLAETIECAFLFGSFARGEQQSESDVDLLVIGRASFKEIARLIAEPQRKLGREININVYTPAEWSRKFREHHHFVTQVAKERKIFIVGSQHELAGMAKERVGQAASGRSKPDRVA